ncbi:MAG: benzoyl-CoA reductase subunit D [Kofleriaceae bacterium]|nr:benzoyl-CoA reductase subunit D [Kofleriaceae bacterium]MCL4222952.1 benzoyl-CoA reductase subunit D [Myxococcales bacterium]
MQRLTTCGIDVGSSSIKVVVLDDDGDGGGALRATHLERIRRRDPRAVLRAALTAALDAARVEESDLAYVASTGDGDVAEGVRTGHFYGMTCHARGAIFLEPEARAVLDVGALWARAIVVDARAKVLASRMTSQCAAGTGQFIENIARYLGVRLDEVGALSQAAARPEPVSGICAVLAETDVINMVSRGVSTAEILRGIHESVAIRLAKLLRAAKAGSPVLVTGGLAQDAGLLACLRDRLAESGGAMEVRSHPLGVHAGAIGAALWAAFRRRKLAAGGPVTGPDPRGDASRTPHPDA